MSEVSPNLEFEMPRPTIGQIVLWHPTGLRSSRGLMAGYVLHVGSRTVTVQMVNGQRRDAVRHIDDPKLQLNADQREHGAWDFTDEHKSYIEFRDLVEEFMRDFQQQPASLNEYHRLLAEAKELGVESPHKMKKDELAAAIKKAKQS